MTRAAVALALTSLLSPPAEATLYCNSNSTICYEKNTSPIFVLPFSAVNGVQYQVTTSDLSGGEDTILFVVNTSNGTLIASNDDYSGTASRVTFTASSSFSALVIVASYLTGYGGTTDLTVVNLGTGANVVTPVNDAEFGGFRTALTAKSGDRLMVAPAPDLAAGVTEHAVFANRLFVFTNSALNCTS